MEFIYNQIFFYIAIAGVLFIPGYLALLAVFGQDRDISLIERAIISVGVSIILVDFLMLLMARIGIALSGVNLGIGLTLLSVSLAVIWKRKKTEPAAAEVVDPLFYFNKKQTIFIIVLIFATIFLKAIYLKDTVLPASTDLGHHMYWSKVISTSQAIPDYEKREITLADGHYVVSDPFPIDDFIIGEHLIFSAVHLISGLDYLSYFPVLLLFLINIFTVLVIFILTLRLFAHHPQAQKIGILALLVTGPIFAVLPPQAKYVGGGVVGNILGNLLLPLCIYFFYRFLEEKRLKFLMMALLFSMGLFFTHHLTGLLFLFTLVLVIVFLLLFRMRDTLKTLALLRQPRFFISMGIFLSLAALFVLFVYTPTYLENQAVNTVVGAPAKKEHTGLTINQFKYMVGEPRLAMGLIGALVVLGTFKKHRLQTFFLTSWLLVILSITFWPNFIRLSIPSGRVANYGSYPLAIVSSLAFVSVFSQFSKSKKNNPYLNPNLMLASFAALFFFLFQAGLFDNFQNLPRENPQQKVAETFRASQYLAARSTQRDVIITDHIYLTADSWVKLFFLRDYNYPFYRANFERYENNIDKKEFCSLWMISNPGEINSQQCYTDLDVKFVLVNQIDTPQFQRSNRFSKLYESNNVAIYRSHYE